MKNGCLIIVIVFVVFVIGMCALSFVSSEPKLKPPTITVLPPPEVPAKSLDEKIKAQFSPWDGSHYKLTRFVKGIMNDPKSFDHVETRHWKADNGNLIVGMTFRGKNAFGGVIADYTEAEVDLDGNVIQILK